MTEGLTLLNAESNGAARAPVTTELHVFECSWLQSTNGKIHNSSHASLCEPLTQFTANTQRVYSLTEPTFFCSQHLHVIVLCMAMWRQKKWTGALAKESRFAKLNKNRQK